MRLQDIAVQGVEDSAEGSNGMQINDKRKSFLVYCESAQEKMYWLKTMKRFIKLSRMCFNLVVGPGIPCHFCMSASRRSSAPVCAYRFLKALICVGLRRV